MQYTDDGKTLDYDLLKDCYPVGRAWAKFLKNHKTEKDDFVYYGRHRNFGKPFNPPVITGLINLASRNMLLPVQDFEEDEKETESEKKDDKKKLEQTVPILESSIKEKAKEEWVGEGYDEYLRESTQENTARSTSSDDEKRMERELEETGKKKRGSSRKKERRRSEGRKKGRRKSSRRGRERTEEEKVEKMEVVDVKRGEGMVPNYLINRIPTDWGEFKGESIYNINRLFYFDPVNPSL